jgi:translation elongation factor EF-Tu-like GTPase
MLIHSDFGKHCKKMDGTLTKHLGLKLLVVFITTCDTADKELIKLVEMEIRGLLEEMGFSKGNTSIVKGSALCALEDTKPELGVEASHQPADGGGGPDHPNPREGPGCSLLE